MRIAAALIWLAGAMLGCGDESPDNAVDAQEQNTVEVAGVDYRVLIFREMNVRQPPDDTIWTTTPPDEGSGAYIAVVRACAANGSGARTTDEIHLEDAFGERFEPLPSATADEFEYDATRLEAGECQPAPGSAAARTLDGSALVFRVPFDSVAERPMVLEIGAPDGEREARIQLDL